MQMVQQEHDFGLHNHLILFDCGLNMRMLVISFSCYYVTQSIPLLQAREHIDS